MTIGEWIILILVFLFIGLYAEEIKEILYSLAFWTIVGFFYLLASMFVLMIWIVDRIMDLLGAGDYGSD